MDLFQSPSSSVKARQLRIVTPILQKTWLGKQQNIELKRKYLSSKQFILSAPGIRQLDNQNESLSISKLRKKRYPQAESRDLRKALIFRRKSVFSAAVIRDTA